MALTLVEAAKVSGDRAQITIARTWSDVAPILNVLPVQSIRGGAHYFTREATLPTSGFRAINAGYASSQATFDPSSVKLVPLGGQIDVDTKLVEWGGSQVRATQTTAQLKSQAHTFANACVKGEQAVDPRSFNGLQVLTAGRRTMSITAASSTGALSVSNDLDRAIDSVPGANAILMSQANRRRLTKILVNSPHIREGRDGFGRQVTFYGGVQIVETDPPDSYFRTLGTYTEVNSANTAQTNRTSIYVVNFSLGNVYGIQDKPPAMVDLGEIDEKPVLRARVDWGCAVVVENVHSVTRLRDISNVDFAA